MEETKLENANSVDKIQKKKRVLEDKGAVFYSCFHFAVFVLFYVKSNCVRS